MARFYELFDDLYIIGRWHLCEPMTDEGCDPYDFTAGKPARVLSQPNIEIQYVGAALDFTMTAFAVPVASPRLAEAFARIADTALQCIPVRIGHREGYKILVATRLVRCLDERRSDFLKWTEADGRPDRTGSYRMVTKLHIDATMVPPDTHIFRIADWDGALIISSEMVAAAKSFGATGLKLTPVD